MNYPEVITNLNFIIIQTTLLETRTRKLLQNPDNPTNNNFTQSDAYVTNNPEKIVRILNELRQSLSTNPHFYESQSATHEDMQLYKTSCKLDLITKFVLTPPELMTIVDMVGKYYGWFNVSSKPDGTRKTSRRPRPWSACQVSSGESGVSMRTNGGRRGKEQHFGKGRGCG